jgi:hypothetical protein
VRAGARAGRSYFRGSRAIRQTGLPSAAQSTGSLVMEAIGIGIGLSLLYLILNEKGKGPLALSTLLKGLESALRIFIDPVDPLKAFGGASSSSTTTAEAQNNTPALKSKAQTKNLNPKFGPAPGIGTVITPIGR